MKLINDNDLNKKYICFLPFFGEFGWYLMTYVKWIHSYNHKNKIICCKKNHDILFPTAKYFFYDWDDIHDSKKAGIVKCDYDLNIIKNKIIEIYGNDILFLDPSEHLGWNELTSLGNFDFIPTNKYFCDLKVDIAICPRFRTIDSFRNWKIEYWQLLINLLKKDGYTIGLCGTKNSNIILNNIDKKSYHFFDLDSDVEMLKNCKLFIGQESGMKYLALKCKTPNLILDTQPNHINISDCHMDKNIFNKSDYFKYWNSPINVYNDAISYLRSLI